MLTLPSIGVVIPNRNDSEHLTTCLKSVTTQSTKVDQIIFVDDFSDDDSLSKAHSQLHNIDGVTIISNQSCLGTMGALNLGLKQANTDYVFFLSSNDYLLEEMVERAKLSICKFGNVGVWSAMVWAVNDSGRSKYIYPTPIVALKETYFSATDCVSLAVRHGNWFTGTTLVYHRKSLCSIGGFDVEYAGLADLYAALTVSSLKGAIFNPEPLGVMRKHSGGYLSRTLTNKNGLEEILTKIRIRGPKLSKNLFTEKFLSRNINRILFAVMRESDFTDAHVVYSNKAALRYRALKLILFFFKNHPAMRMTISLIFLRPFDLWPTFLYRILGVMAVKFLNKNFPFR